MATVGLTGLKYSTTGGTRFTKDFFACSPLCPWWPSWFAVAWTAIGRLPTLIEEGREEDLAEKKEPSGAPQNSVLPPMTTHAAPGGPSISQPASEQLPAAGGEATHNPAESTDSPVRRWRLRFLLEIIKKHDASE